MSIYYPEWAVVGFKELMYRVRELPGAEHSPRVLEYHQATGLGASDDETPWCSAFVNWCLRQAMVQGTESAGARSFEKWGDEVEARVGSIVVLWRESRDDWRGHVGIEVGRTDASVFILGGNQGNAVSIKPFRVDRVLTNRWPTPDLLRFNT